MIHEWLKFYGILASKYSSPIWRIWVTWNPLMMLVVLGILTLEIGG